MRRGLRIAWLVMVGCGLASAEAAVAANDGIEKGHRLKIEVKDLGGPGKPALVVAVVDDQGKVRLPLISKVTAAGRTPAQLERDISDAYEKHGIMKGAQVTVTNEGKAEPGK